MSNAAGTKSSGFEVVAAKMFGLEEKDVKGVSLLASSGFFLMSSYYLIQPLSDQLALHVGVKLTPLISVGRLILIAVINPLYSGFVKSVPTERVIPILYRFLACTLALFVVGFLVFPSGQEDQVVSFSFAIWSGVFSLFMISTFWARIAHLHTRDEARRVYGVISAGAEGGQLASSALAGVIYYYFQQRILLLSMLLMEITVFFLGLRAKWRPPPESSSASAGGSSAGSSSASSASAGSASSTSASSTSSSTSSPSGGASCAASVSEAIFGPFRVLMSTPLLRQLTGHTLLINVLVAGVWYERADAVAAAFATDAARFSFFSGLNFAVAALTLVIQSLCFSRVLSRIGTTNTLLAEPLALALGLTCTIVQPGIVSIAILDGLRKVVHYSLLKPVKESLYAALPADVQYRAKPLLDTFVYRTGSVVGAAYFTWALNIGMTPMQRRLFLLALTAAWTANSYMVGTEAERHHARENAARAGTPML